MLAENNVKSCTCVTCGSGQCAAAAFAIGEAAAVSVTYYTNCH